MSGVRVSHRPPVNPPKPSRHQKDTDVCWRVARTFSPAVRFLSPASLWRHLLSPSLAALVGSTPATQSHRGRERQILLPRHTKDASTMRGEAPGPVALGGSAAYLAIGLGLLLAATVVQRHRRVSQGHGGCGGGAVRHSVAVRARERVTACASAMHLSVQGPLKTLPDVSSF